MCTLLKQTSIHICIETTVKILILVIIYDFELLLATVICFSLIFWKVQLISIKWESQNHISELEFRSHWRPYAPTPILWIVKMVIIHHESEWVCAGIKDFKSQPPFITLSERGWTKHFAYVKKKKFRILFTEPPCWLHSQNRQGESCLKPNGRPCTYSAERNLSFKCLHSFLLTFHLYSYFIYVQKALHSVNRRITDYRLMILKTLPQPFSDEGENEYHIFFYCL